MVGGPQLKFKNYMLELLFDSVSIQQDNCKKVLIRPDHRIVCLNFAYVSSELQVSTRK